VSKILIIDDSATIRAGLAAEVRAMKFEPLTGEQGVAVFTAELPALVLLDVNMPGIDGYETARRIRAARTEEWTPIIFLSASEDDQDQGVHRSDHARRRGALPRQTSRS
jgi:DNA-binding response OmpR family regulator